ncbi:hypothetical protein F5Y04DRAFT_261248 [Hypomontagnella monticulosa]|nr:hypothetical protein F5Y04DRAFT_261248 [Hypomontagnella monticulosa]
MSTRSESSATSPKGSSNDCQAYSVPLQDYLASPPTITERHVFPLSSKDAQQHAISKEREVKASLDSWQSSWDKMK